MLANVDVLLLDIEGTITSISFVKDVLFPYIRNSVRDYIVENYGSEELQQDVEALRTYAETELEAGDNNVKPVPAMGTVVNAGVVDATVANVHHWMDLDRKCTPLKQLQGHMWRHAYRKGIVKGHLYPDVVPVLRQIASEGTVKICIYSSGSVEAQKLLVAHSCDGDVSDLFENHFDTNVGLKTDTSSYRRIADILGTSPSKILFLTDVEREGYPAREVGYQVLLLNRPGNAPLPEKAKQDFTVIDSLDPLLS